MKNRKDENQNEKKFPIAANISVTPVISTTNISTTNISTTNTEKDTSTSATPCDKIKTCLSFSNFSLILQKNPILKGKFTYFVNFDERIKM